MGLVTCSDCGRPVSELAPACPTCGRPNAAGPPVAIPIEPRPLGIFVGLALVVFAGWLLTTWIPSHRPMDPTELLSYFANCKLDVLQCARHWTFKPAIYPWAYVVAALIGLLGVNELVRGATYRSYREVTCRTCNARVVGKKTFAGVMCPTGNHLAVHQFVTAFAILVVAIVAFFLVKVGTSTNSAPSDNLASPSPAASSPPAPPPHPVSTARPIRATATACNIQRAIFGLDKAHVTCRVVNLSGANAEVTLRVSFESDTMPEVATTADVSVAAGAAVDKRVDLEKVDSGRSRNPRCVCAVE